MLLPKTSILWGSTHFIDLWQEDELRLGERTSGDEDEHGWEDMIGKIQIEEN